MHNEVSEATTRTPFLDLDIIRERTASDARMADSGEYRLAFLLDSIKDREALLAEVERLRGLLNPPDVAPSDTPQDSYDAWFKRAKPDEQWRRGRKSILITINGKQHIARFSLLSYYWIVWLAQMPFREQGRPYKITYEKASAPTAKGEIRYGDMVKVRNGTVITCVMGAA